MKLFARTALVLAAAIALASCSGGSDDAFVNEYEDLNGVENANGAEHMAMDIPDDHRFVYASEEELRELLTDGNGAIYFGFPECPWCRNAVPAMDEAAKTMNLDEIHYLNVYDIRDQKSLDENGEIVVDEEGTDFYYYLLEELGDHAPEYGSLDDPSERRISVPLVVAVVNGNVVANHLGTVESQTDPSVPMTDDQHQELVNAYMSMFAGIPGCGIDICE